MKRKSLIHIRTTRTWTGNELRLEYFITNEPIMDGCAENYGVEIRARTGTTEEYAGVDGITMLGSRILALIDLLAAGSVTPTGLYETVQEWL